MRDAGFYVVVGSGGKEVWIIRGRTLVGGRGERVSAKAGLWTLDWTMDWTMDWNMDSILDSFTSQGLDQEQCWG